jgi:hypothetical protein
MKTETTYNTEASAILTAKSFGAINFKGTTENCQVLTFSDINGVRLGHIYASYNENFTKVYRVRYNNSSN